MTLAAKTRLGPYEIVEPLGAGGMGEVYRARDTRLGRDVAVKVLPRAMASDPERQQRFEAEARAAGALNHPNIVTLHDVGVADGAPYLVTEVLEGEDLRALIKRGPVPLRRAIDLIVQLSAGLSAAHAKGIVHRDLKPENIFLLADGRLKILDFGIAKLTRAETASEAETTPVFASLTAAGTIMGTVSYMAPEQLRDRPVDQRADLFAVGVILHELLTGKQPFHGETAADRVSAILVSDPPALPVDVEKEAPGIGAVVARLLAKRPEQRFDSAGDLAFTLTLLKGRPAPPAEGAAAGATPAPGVAFRQLTFRDGEMGGARFAPDGQTVVYDAAWGAGDRDVYLTRIESPESTSLGIPGGELQGVSAMAEVAVTLRVKDFGGFVRLGTLARVPLVGGRPREIVDSVFFADWTPDGRNLAAIRVVEGGHQIEAPIGRLIHRTHGWVSHLRYSPDGSLLGFLDHPTVGDNGGHVSVIAPGGEPRRLTPRFEMTWRLAWRPDSKEIWFGAHEAGEAPAVYGVTLDGALRRVFAPPGWAIVEDVARNGDALFGMVRPRMRLETGTRAGGPGSVRDLSWLDWTLARDMSADGSLVLFDETGLGSAAIAGVYLRPTDGSPAIRLSDGVCHQISPDGRFVFAVDHRQMGVLLVVPTGVGETRKIDLGDHAVINANWIPGSNAALILASKAGGPRLLYRLDLDTHSLQLVNKDVVAAGSNAKVSPDGKRAAVRAVGGIAIVSLEDGSSRILPGPDPLLIPCDWTGDGRGIFMVRRGEIPGRVTRVDAESGASEPWIEIWPMVRSGVDGINSVCLSADGERYAYSYQIIDSTLYLARGLA